MISPRFLPEHKGTFRAIGRALLQQVPPLRKDAADGPVQRRVHAPSAALVDAFRVWSGSPTPEGTVPPALFCQWAMAPALRAALPTGLPVHKVLNQGTRLTLHAPIAVGAALDVSATLSHVERGDGKTRLSLTAETCADGVLCQTAVFHAVVIHGRSTGARTAPPAWTAPEEVATLSFGARDGQEFALLTGDINPIHWLPPAAKLSGFSGVVLHGFGTFAKTFAALQRAGLDVQDIDVRFLKPVPLPAHAAVDIQARPADDGMSHDIRVTVPGAGRPALAGRFSTVASAEAGA